MQSNSSLSQTDRHDWPRPRSGQFGSKARPTLTAPRPTAEPWTVAIPNDKSFIFLLKIKNEIIFKVGGREYTAIWVFPNKNFIMLTLNFWSEISRLSKYSQLNCGNVRGRLRYGPWELDYDSVYECLIESKIVFGWKHKVSFISEFKLCWKYKKNEIGSQLKTLTIV